MQCHCTAKMAIADSSIVCHIWMTGVLSQDLLIDVSIDVPVANFDVLENVRVLICTAHAVDIIFETRIDYNTLWNPNSATMRYNNQP